MSGSRWAHNQTLSHDKVIEGLECLAELTKKLLEVEKSKLEKYKSVQREVKWNK